jgi:hypothetical protein
MFLQRLCNICDVGMPTTLAARYRQRHADDDHDLRLLPRIEVAGCIDFVSHWVPSAHRRQSIDGHATDGTVNHLLSRTHLNAHYAKTLIIMTPRNAVFPQGTRDEIQTCTATGRGEPPDTFLFMPINTVPMGFSSDH